MTERVPKELQATYDAIVKLTDQICNERLNDEYAELCHQLAGKLARKRPSPLLSGKVNTWAAAIVYTIGRVNFVFDKSQTPHITSRDLSAAFNLSQNTVSAKAKTIMDMFKIRLMDPDWTLPSRMDDNLMAWMISVNGYILDARFLPREIQAIAFEKGLIPYIPGEKPNDPNSN